MKYFVVQLVCPNGIFFEMSSFLWNQPVSTISFPATLDCLLQGFSVCHLGLFIWPQNIPFWAVFITVVLCMFLVCHLDLFTWPQNNLSELYLLVLSCMFSFCHLELFIRPQNIPFWAVFVSVVVCYAVCIFCSRTYL